MSTALTDTADERALIAAAQVGDERAFRRLVDPYCGALEVHCYRMLGSLDDAEDFLQETLLRAWRRLDRFERRASMHTRLRPRRPSASNARREPRQRSEDRGEDIRYRNASIPVGVLVDERLPAGARWT